MTVFAVIAPSFNEQLEQAVKSVFPDRFYVIAPGQYLVSADRTTVTQVLDRLKMTDGSKGRAVILLMASYTGWHSKDMWDWIAAQSGPATPPVPDPPSVGNE